MTIDLNPVEEHFLKKELLRKEITQEFDRLSPEFNDISGLRRFGPPFVPMDPQMVHKMGINLEELHNIGENMKGMVRDQFPVLRYILENFIQTFPFIKIHLNKLGATWIDQSPFWLKIQTLFEIWKGKKISSSNDRGSTSKRQLALTKFKSLILMLFNSSVRTFNEDEYFDIDQNVKGAYKKLGKLMTKAEQERLNQLEINEDLEIEDVASSLSLNPDSIEKEDYINGWYVNVIGVTSEIELKKGVIWGTRESQYYLFILRVKREQDDEGWYIKRRYNDFKELAHQMKLLYPNVKRPYLPSKSKHNGTLNNDGVNDDPITLDDDQIDIENLIQEDDILKSAISPSVIDSPKPTSNGSFKIKTPKTPNLGTFSIGKLERSFKKSLKVPIKSHHRSSSDGSESSFEPVSNLPRDHLRMALRGYIRALLKRESLIKAPELIEFLTNSPMLLTPEEQADVQSRMKLDHLVTMQHLKFQKALVTAVGDLESEVLKMKKKLYERGFHYLFDELKEKDSIQDLSGPIKGVVEVLELEIASTVYEMFIGSDGGPETYRMVKRMHRLMPYKMMSTILRFTNPLQMVKKFIDLFTFQPFGKGRSLLQIIFMGALTDDLKKYDDELKGLVDRFNTMKLETIYQRIDEYFTSDDDVVLKIKEISKITGLELAVAVLMPRNGLTSNELEPKLLSQILQDFKDGIRRDDSIYTLCVRYFQRKLRRWDKEMMRELWEASEMMDVIKDLMSIFFEPLIELFKRAEVYKYVPIFQKFMNELIQTCDDYLYENGSLRGDIVVSLVSLEDKYSSYVYKFMREMYLNDLKMPQNQRLFDGMIDWMNDFIHFLSRGQHGDAKDRLNLGSLVSELSEEDQSKLKTCLGEIINRVEKKRELYMEIEEGQRVRRGLLDENWDKIHDRVYALGNIIGVDPSGNFDIDDHDADDEDFDEAVSLNVDLKKYSIDDYDSMSVFLEQYTKMNFGPIKEVNDPLSPLLGVGFTTSLSSLIFNGTEDDNMDF